MDCNLGQDTILSTTKNCNDYDKYGDWEYYCTLVDVRRHRRFYNYACSDGACRMLSNNYADDTLISKKGDSDYCTKRKEGYDKVWSGCALCGKGDYDCDSDNECYGSLKCMGPIGGNLDGCCSSGEWWDETNYRCCECSSGSCCDGCHYRPSSYVCDYHYGSYQYGCEEGNCLDDDVYKIDKRQYCSGTSSSCNGRTEWNTPVVHKYCSSNQFCDGSERVYSSEEKSCKTAQCTSGVCCDSNCGVYAYKSSSTKCSEETVYGCPWGTDLDDDVGKRTVSRYCSGSSSSCSGQLQYGEWSVYKYCTGTQYCENGNCKAITCSDSFDCGGYGTSYWFCKDNDTWAKWDVNECNNAGTKDSYCTHREEDRLHEDCGESGYTGDNYCYGNNIYRNFTNRGCSGNPGGDSGHAACFKNQEQKLIKICQQGCTLGQCNEEKSTSFNIYLNQGWNLISFPLNLTNKFIKDVFKNINFKSVFSYGSWSYYFNETHNNFKIINESKGYWVNSLGNQLLIIEGTKFDSLNLPLKKGSNLIGYPSLDEKAISDLFKNVTVYTYNSSKWYSYDSNRQPQLNTLNKFTPGHGYWVK